MATQPDPNAEVQEPVPPPAATDTPTQQKVEQAPSSPEVKGQPETENAIAAVVAADPNLEATTLALPKDALEFLRKEAAKRGITTGAMVRLSIGTQKFLTETIEQGGTLQMRNAKGVFELKV